MNAKYIVVELQKVKKWRYAICRIVNEPDEIPVYDIIEIWDYLSEALRRVKDLK